MRKIGVWVVILVICLGASPVAFSLAGEEKILRVGIPGDVETLDPDFSRYPLSNSVILNVYEQWFRYGTVDTGEGYFRSNVKDIRGAAVESWEVAEDRMSLLIHIRKGVTFVKSGNEMTADDFIYWYERGIHTKSGILWNLQAAGIKNFEKVDDYTVRVNFEYPMQDMFFMLARDQCWGVIDSKEAKNHATPDDPWSTQWLAKHDAGCGEFYVESWEPGVRMVLAANPNYWAGKAYFDKVILEVIPSSATRALLLQQGAIDIAMGLSTDEIDRLRGVPGVTVISALSRSQSVIHLNCDKFPFCHQLLRQAIGYLIPYETILNEVFGGRGFVPKGPIPVLGQGHNPSFWIYEYNPEKAKELLAKAGFPNGFEFTLNVRAGEATGRTIAIILQNAMKEVGIKMNIREVPPAVFAEEEAKGIAQASLWPTGYIMYVDDPWYAMRAYLSYSATNRSHYTNYAVDWIYDKLRVTFDPAERKELIDLWQKIIVWDLPKAFIAEHAFEYVLRSDIKGFVFLEDTNYWFYPLYREEAQ